MALIAAITVAGLYAGQVAQLAGDSRSSAIVKTAVSGPRLLTVEGLAGDAQADRRAHGGGGKALHHYPAEHYARLAAAFPEAQHLAPGGLGENLSTRGVTEEDICIGDVFRLGGARIQVSQPRTPCWKIDRRTEWLRANDQESSI
ncbi:MAG: MOSC domain-containing protein [Sulfuritalea sp.]|nr:MOSC domain-containing protein [Sulfuritalea sp.]MDP1982020.1 MOSC domain-containing protein [Sulfuritalea sp.]